MARNPIHPGEHLAEELRETQHFCSGVGAAIDVPVTRVAKIING